MPDEKPITAVDLFTQHHHYSGQIVSRGVRLSDILSDGRLNVVEIDDTLLRTEGVRSTELQCGKVFVKKADLLLVIPRGEYEAPERRLNNYRRKDRYGAVVAIPGMVLSGVVYLPPRPSPWMLLDDNAGLPRFFGMTEVTVHGSIHAYAPPECETVILQRHAIESVQLTAKPLPEPEPEATSCGP
ncbi:MAG: hypothetical protein ACYTG0_38020 [Planctomycetota bacterium]|jgi:hypothetical protein